MKRVPCLVASVFATVSLSPGCVDQDGGAEGTSTPLREDAAQRAVEAVHEIRRLTLAEDWMAIFDRMPADLFPGGEAALRRAKEAAPRDSAGWKKSGVLELSENMQPELPESIHAVAGRHVCVVRYRSRVKGRDFKGCQIAISTDGGASWEILSGSEAAVSYLRDAHRVIYQAIKDDVQPVELVN